ncbi:YhgE/Pip domain-containing protein [Bifidobacterium sp. B4081]|uniref:YhgE/Pip domain-containing protein n=1 Tax=unclassified Bifidobacterium TaxID=2608897 RepID=UPI00226AC6A5|nr:MULTISPECIES: YhgE/Pip domain-containing protein [unclassified Bifidobacterium]MCX8644767.1 YhgE/Pip domain-containing protein [Bifidobacterium sp. B4077]MCX8646581.1 YhgE/Pip domain-containing protein [Bifidobacterium sp. B4081]MCX8668286.1 YhgE/Pip domain-containing protein [Bifidobacterium sp. B3998]
MRNIWRILRKDLADATSNVIAIIVLMGLIIVPALYAWFNIAASWDPYKNTKAIKVAVANTDKGYKSDLIPVRINVGETVTSTLRANDQLDWRFVNRDQALEGVRSGEYYAAIVIPKDFSADMMTLFSQDVKHASLEYYLNEKKNAIAPHVTEQGADTVATTIDKTFVKTVGQVGIDLASQVFTYSQSPQVQDYLARATGHIDQMSQRLTTASSQVNAYAGLLDSSGKMIDATGRILGRSDSAMADARKALNQGTKGSKDLGKSLSGSAQAVDVALDQASGAYDTIGSKIDDAFDKVGQQSDAVSSQLNYLNERIRDSAADYDGMIASLEDLRSTVESDANLTADQRQALLTAIDQAQAGMRTAQAAQRDLADRISQASQAAKEGKDKLGGQRQDLKNRIAQARASVDQVRTQYRNDLKPRLDDLASSMDTVVTSTDRLLTGLDGTVKGASGLTGPMTRDISQAKDQLGEISQRLEQASKRLTDLGGHLTQASQGKDTQEVKTLLSGDSETMAALLSSPVGIHRHAVFPVMNYGSAMTPFYTILSIWVGATILAAMMKVALSDKKKASVLHLDSLQDAWKRADDLDEDSEGRRSWGDFRPESPGNARRFGLQLYQEYFGRFAVFALMAILQGCLIALGDLFYLKVQCVHPLMFVLVAVFASFVFMNLIYTLVVSFGDIGKAIAVILLVMQVAGSGGTFPMETLPGFFQGVYPFLPFVHAIGAMQSAVAGAYGMEFWREMATLALFLVPSLLLGLVLRKPVIRFNDWIVRNLESTRLM